MRVGTFAAPFAMGAALLTAGGNPAFSQTSPVPAAHAITEALRPIPPVLRVGKGGLPDVGGSSQQPRITDFGATRPSRSGTRPKLVASGLPSGCPAAPAALERRGASFSQITFEFGSAQLKAEALPLLRELATSLNHDLSDQKLFLIEGHTDAVGTIAYNTELSKLRAEAVKDFLVRDLGVAAERLEAVGKAYCDPANRQNPRAEENRRVVVINPSS
jgi:OmpA-OmpF porin, OOP family